MKKSTFIATLATAALALAGCNKEQAVTPAADPDAGTKSITVTINGAGVASKAAISGSDEYEENTHDFSTVDIYFTNANDVVIVGRRVEKGDSDEWNSLVGNNSSAGVRYVGLEGVSKVYVVANATGEKIADGANLNTFILNLEDYAANVEQNTIPYVGGDDEITPLKDEILDGVGASVDPTTGEAATPEEGQQYYTADVTVRPVISRLQIKKISVVNSGELEIDGSEIGEAYNGKKYLVKWEGFAPVLGGIYMSNIYGAWQPVPANTAATDFFSTPTGQEGISEGKWADGSGIGTDINVENVTWYSNWNSGTSEYDELFEADPVAESSKSVYFDGTDAGRCVPFNFLVNYDVRAEGEDIAASPALNLNEPHFHFQFQYENPASSGYAYHAYDITDSSDPSDANEIKPDGNDQDLYQALVKDFVFEVTVGNLYYANIVQFNNAATSGTKVDIKPAKIYNMDEVVINPYNLTTGTVKPQDERNVIVYVTVVDFDNITVYPSFE